MAPLIPLLGLGAVAAAIAMMKGKSGGGAAAPAQAAPAGTGPAQVPQVQIPQVQIPEAPAQIPPEMPVNVVLPGGTPIPIPIPNVPVTIPEVAIPVSVEGNGEGVILDVPDRALRKLAADDLNSSTNISELARLAATVGAPTQTSRILAARIAAIQTCAQAAASPAFGSASIEHRKAIASALLSSKRPEDLDALANTLYQARANNLQLGDTRPVEMMLKHRAFELRCVVVTLADLANVPAQSVPPDAPAPADDPVRKIEDVLTSYNLPEGVWDSVAAAQAAAAQVIPAVMPVPADPTAGRPNPTPVPNAPAVQVMPKTGVVQSGEGPSQFARRNGAPSPNTDWRKLPLVNPAIKFNADRSNFTNASWRPGLVVVLPVGWTGSSSAASIPQAIPQAIPAAMPIPAAQTAPAAPAARTGTVNRGEGPSSFARRYGAPNPNTDWRKLPSVNPAIKFNADKSNFTNASWRPGMTVVLPADWRG